MTTDSIVAMLGAIIAAPLQTPETRTVAPATTISTDVRLGNVSVVIIAVAASRKCFSDVPSDCTPLGMPSRIVRIGKGTPMTPVEHTKTDFASQPSCSARADVINSASRIPGSPVAAFELPELIMTARATVDGTRCFDTITGAPQILFVVKTPVAVASRSETNNAKSGLPLTLIPQVEPEA